MMIHEIRNQKSKERVWLKYPRSMIPFDMLYFYLDENLRGIIGNNFDSPVDSRRLLRQE